MRPLTDPIHMFRYRAWRVGLAAAVALLLAPGTSRSQCSYWTPGPLPGAGIGADGEVRAMTAWNNGTQNLLVIGGDFQNVDGVPASYVAAWDGIVWRALSTGTTGPVYSLTTWNGFLAAGGLTPGSFPYESLTLPMVEWFDGNGWIDLSGGLSGSSPDTVFAVASYNGRLYAGGHYVDTSINPGLNYRNIASYGSSPAGWVPLLGGTSGPVYSLCPTSGLLYVGGTFRSADTVSIVPNIAGWNGSGWSRVDDGSGNGPHQAVIAMLPYGGNLFVGLHYPSTEGVLQWTGSNWQPAGTLCSSVWTLATHNGSLYAGGTFSTPHGCAIQRVAQWNGSDWGAVGLGIDPSLGTSGPPIVDALLSFNGMLFASGAFLRADNVVANDLAEWNGSAWNATAVPLDVLALSTYGSKLAIGGYFEQNTSAIGGNEAYHLMSWDGTNLNSLGYGVDLPVYALKGFTTGSGFHVANNLVVGGSFMHAGGIPAPHIAMWTEQSFFPFSSWSTMGSGFDNAVYALDFLNGALVAGGAFLSSGVTATSNIGRWNGSSWQPMGLGMNAAVHALKSYSAGFTEGVIVAGGDFTLAGGVVANHVASWSKSTLTVQDGPWTPIGNGVNGSVYAIERYGGRTYVGGAFSADGSGATALNSIAAWNGSAWVAVGSTPGGGFNGPVYALRADDGYLYASGSFSAVDGLPAANVARWNGSVWSAVDVGTDGPVSVLTSSNGELIAGGAFNWAESSANPSPGVARFIENAVPWVRQEPASQAIAAGTQLVLTMTFASGYITPTSFQWRKNGTPMVDGPTGYGSSVNGSGAQFLTIYPVQAADSAGYDCVYANSCGVESTSVAMVTVTYPVGVAGRDAASGLGLAVWPNPARGSAEVDFTLRATLPAEAVVYDEQGKRVRTLARGVLPSGRQHLQWDGLDERGRRVGPGIFFVRITAPGRTAKRKLVLLE